MRVTDHVSGGHLSELSFSGADFSGWPYYLLCSLFFISCGIVAGYIIWRRGYMQTLDVESEVRHTGDELVKLREDLKIEEEEVNPGRGTGEMKESISVTTDQKVRASQ